MSTRVLDVIATRRALWPCTGIQKLWDFFIYFILPRDATECQTMQGVILFANWLHRHHGTQIVSVSLHPGSAETQLGE